MRLTSPIRWFRRPVPAAASSQAPGFDPGDFSPALHTQLLIFQPTPFCNIDCDYCYLPDRENPARLSVDTIRLALQRLADDRLLGDGLSVAWHAGEPLVLPVAFYEEAFGAVADVVAGLGCVVRHSIQTNATLIDEAWCEFFARHGVRVGVSVDGPADLHDLHRRTRRGGSTHARVLGSMALLRQAGIPFHVIAVITRDALARAQDIHDFFVAHGVADVGMNFDEAEGAHRASGLAGCDDAHAAFIAETLALSMRANGRYRVRELTTATALIAEAPPLQRQGDERWPANAQTTPFAIVTVGWSGDFSTFSPELLGQPAADHHDFVLGNVHRGGFLEAAATEGFGRLWRAVAEGCRACERSCAYFRYCGGGAPANKFYEHGRFDVAETLYCRATIKRPFDAVLRAIEEGGNVAAQLGAEAADDLPERGCSHVR